MSPSIFSDNSEFELLPFENTAVHYEAIAAVTSAIFPDYPEDPDDMRVEDETKPFEAHWERYLVRRKGTEQIVAYGSWGHTYWAFHPQRYFLGVYVHPAWEQRGLGRALYDALEPLAMAREPESLECETRSDKLRGIRFAEANGYKLATKEHASRLLIDEFDPSAFPAAPKTVTLYSFAELARSAPEDYLRQIYELEVEVGRDIPWHGSFTHPPYELWQAALLQRGTMVPEMCMVAIADGEYVGLTFLQRNKVRDDVLYTGTTGVRRAYRRQGIALALKVESLVRAKRYFAERTAVDGKTRTPMIITENEVNNPMFGINYKLGFRAYADWLFYIKKFV
jgi:mycothiol synthase